ncbi:hypothetical protein KCV05_g197, partial [Aureobasidium melanogenum]
LRLGSFASVVTKHHAGNASFIVHRRSIAKVSEAHVERCNYPVSTASRFIRTSQARWTVADMTGAQSCHPAFRSSDDVAIRTTVLYTTIGTSRADDKVQLLAFLQRLNAENNSLGEVDNDTRCPSCRLVIIGCLNISIEDTKTCVFRTHRTCNHLLRPTCSHQSSY